MAVSGSAHFTKVSIGLPIHNGEEFLSEAIDSILVQTFEDFELILCDNASSDGTQRICQEFAGRDGRIKYYRNTTNVGAARNFNWTFELSLGEYFKWAAHDDFLAHDFLEKCVDVLDKNPSIVLCQSEVQFVDDVGKPKENLGRQLMNTGSDDPVLRFADLTVSVAGNWAFDIFGLIRSRRVETNASHM